VCCRIAVYDALPALLSLGGQVTLEPLTGAQIDTYLAAGGPALAPLRDSLRTDPELRQLADTPLMLQVLMTVYGQMPAAAQTGQAAESLEARPSRMLNACLPLLLHRLAPAPPPTHP